MSSLRSSYPAKHFSCFYMWRWRGKKTISYKLRSSGCFKSPVCELTDNENCHMVNLNKFINQYGSLERYIDEWTDAINFIILIVKYMCVYIHLYFTQTKCLKMLRYIYNCRLSVCLSLHPSTHPSIS